MFGRPDAQTLSGLLAELQDVQQKLRDLDLHLRRHIDVVGYLPHGSLDQHKLSLIEELLRYMVIAEQERTKDARP